jgi:sterol desaturase/sphingolipid hydroxylase (fatty acid hydroxylase superfamily)
VSDLAELQRWRGVASVGWLVALLAWETAAPCFACFADWSARGRHAARNLVVGLVNVVIVAGCFAVAWRAVADRAGAHRFGLLNWLGWPDALRAVVAVLLLDAWTYGWHRICHRVPLLWRFHRVHHGDAQMDVTTANRFHLGEIVASSLLRLPLLALLGVRFGELVLYETLLQFVVQWQHANIALPPAWERRLRRFVVTPGLHKVHHSRAQPETDSNFASLLPVWDRLFGSLRRRERPEEIRLGLDGFDDAERQRLAGLFREPFR